MNDPRQPLAPLESQSRQWAMFLHLAQLGNYLLPFGGVIAVIVIWQMKKDEFPGIDAHAREVLNWQISAAIYCIIGLILTLVVVGLLLLVVLGVCALLFAIIGAIKANDGELWRYPLTIRFLT